MENTERVLCEGKEEEEKRTGDKAVFCVPWELESHMDFLHDFIKHRR